MIASKLVPIAVIVLLVWFLFFHGTIPRLTRKAGRKVGEWRAALSELTSGQEVPGSPLARYESQVGRALAARILNERPLAQDLPLQERVAAVGDRLMRHVERREIRYRVGAVISDEPNAFAVPGGCVFITTTLVHLARDDDQLACILGHELAHVDCRHAVKNRATQAATRTGMKLLLLGRGALLSRLGNAVEEMVHEGYSREQELEADRVGCALAERAGYSPRALIPLLETLGSLPPPAARPAAEFLRYVTTHPPVPERIAQVRRVWPESTAGLQRRQTRLQ